MENKEVKNIEVEEAKVTEIPEEKLEDVTGGGFGFFVSNQQSSGRQPLTYLDGSAGDGSELGVIDLGSTGIPTPTPMTDYSITQVKSEGLSIGEPHIAHIK